MIGRKRSAHDVFVLGEEALSDSGSASAVAEPPAALESSASDLAEPTVVVEEFDDEVFFLGDAVGADSSAVSGEKVRQVSAPAQRPTGSRLEAMRERIRRARRDRSESLGRVGERVGRRRKNRLERRSGGSEKKAREEAAPARRHGRATLRRATSALAFGTAAVAALGVVFAAAQLVGRIGGEALPPTPTVDETKPSQKTPTRDSRPRRTRDREPERPQLNASSSAAPSASAPSAPIAASPSPPSQGGGSGGRETFGFEQ